MTSRDVKIWAPSWQNQQSGMCAQRTLRSAWASDQSDQNLRCLHEESFDPLLPTERTAKTLIKLGGCPGWSESSLGAQSFCWFCHEAFIRFTAHAFRKLLSIYIFSYFSFGFEGRMWDLIVSVPNHCLSFYFSFMIRTFKFRDQFHQTNFVVRTS